MVQTTEATDEASRCLKAPGAAADLGVLLFTARLSAGVKRQLGMVRPGLSMFSVFICLRGT